MTHIVKSFSVVNQEEVDVFLEFSCFFYDPTEVGNLISSSFTFSKSCLNIWKFSVYVLLKPRLEKFEQQNGSELGKEYIKAVYCHPAYLTSMQGTS